MSTPSVSLPFDVKEVYGDNPIRPENFQLDNELRAKPGSRSVSVRLLTDFLFIKNGGLVFPYYRNCTKDFWKGVEVWGFMMAPTASVKWFAWSLMWHLDWAHKHMELVRITDVQDMSKEAHAHFRNGNQVALWVNTSQRFSYALMEPEEQIASQWALVCESWREVGPEKLSVPYCGPLSTLLAPPVWWHKKGEVDGRTAWQQLVDKQTKYLKKMEGEEDVEEEVNNEESPPPKRQQSAPKGKGKQGAPKRSEREENPQTRIVVPQQPDQHHPLDEAIVQPGTSASRGTAPFVTLANKRARAVTRPDTHGGGPSSRGQEISSSNDAPESSPPARKRPRKGPADEPAFVTVRSLLTEKPARKERMQRESDSDYSPRFGTQQANTLPSLARGGVIPPLVLVRNSSSPIEPETSFALTSTQGLEQGVSRISTVQGVASRRSPGGVQFNSSDVTQSLNLTSTVIEASSGLPGVDMPDSRSHTPPAALTIPTSTLRIPLGLSSPASSPVSITSEGLARATEASSVPELDSARSHQVPRVPGPGVHSASSLDARSSRRHTRTGAA